MTVSQIKKMTTAVQIVAGPVKIRPVEVGENLCVMPHVAPAPAPTSSRAVLAQTSCAYQVAVVKIGGTAINNIDVLDALIDDAIALSRAGVKVVVVHGGGISVNEALRAVGKETVKVAGLRVTDADTLAIAVDVFTAINEQLAAKFKEKGACAIGFSPATTSPFISKKMELEGTGDLGFVGEIVAVDAAQIESWMWAGWIPIVSPIGAAGRQLYNINADHAALALACQLQADGLYFMTDVPGVLQDVDDKDSRIGHLTSDAAEALIADGTISGGMLPKIRSCLGALKNGIGRIAILDGFACEALVAGYLAPSENGTLITGEH
ncbi:MAG: acetylglutamate kinase [Cyanobacteria bacterium REEB67]|nr:acetylglutamate kinase [Cyanobacteria bacterium REEB67]